MTIDTKKILKYTLRGLLILVGVVALAVALLYVPPVQQLIKREAETYVARHFDMRLSMDRFRLRFPLRLTLENTTLVTTRQDTLLHAGKLTARVALLPLLRQDVVVRRFSLEEVAVDYRDTATRFSLVGEIGKLTLKAREIDLRARVANVDFLRLTSGRLVLVNGESAGGDAAPADPNTWDIIADRVYLQNVDVEMPADPQLEQLKIRVDKGMIRALNVDLGAETVTASRADLTRADVVYYTYDSLPVPVPQEALDSLAGDGPGWQVDVRSVRLQGSSFLYGSARASGRAGLDPNHLQFTDINADIDSLNTRGSQFKANVRRLSLAERSGLVVRSMQGGITLDSLQYRVDGLQLRTANSSLTADIAAGSTLGRMAPGTPIRGDISGRIGGNDLLLLQPDVSPALRRSLQNETLSVDTRISGTLDRLDIPTLRLSLPRHFDLQANGTLAHLADPQRLEGGLHLRGNFPDLDLLKDFIPDTALRRRIALPPFTLNGDVQAANGNYRVDLAMNTRDGRLDLNGRLNQRTQTYEAQVHAADFPVYLFLPNDSLGYAHVDITASGHGFDLLNTASAGTLRLNIDQFDYRGYAYSGIQGDFSLQDGKLDGNLDADTEYARLNLVLSGRLDHDTRMVYVKSDVRKLDLYALHLSSQPLGIAVKLEASGEIAGGDRYSLLAKVDSLQIDNGRKLVSFTSTDLKLDTDPGRVDAQVHSGDMRLNFTSAAGLDTLIGRVNQTAALLRRQIAELHFRPDSLDLLLPDYQLTLTAGTRNSLNTYLRSKNIHFQQLVVNSGASASRPFYADLQANRFSTGTPRMNADGCYSGGTVFDTLTAAIKYNEKSVTYKILASNLSQNDKRTARIAAEGALQEDELSLHAFQQDKSGRYGFDFRVEASLIDSGLHIQLDPARLVLGRELWTANPDNYINYYWDNRLVADFRLTNQTNTAQHLYVVSNTSARTLNANVDIDLAQLDLQTTLDLFPGAPDLRGLLDLHVSLDMNRNSIISQGRVNVADLRYTDKAIGNLALDASYRKQDSLQSGNADLQVDGRQALTLTAAYVDADPNGLDAQINIPALPLTLVNAFLPEDQAVLEGSLSGNLQARGALSAPQVSGSLQLTQSRVTVPLIGTSFGISSNPIRIQNSRVQFDDFSLTAPNNQPLTLNGTLDLSNTADVKTDLHLRAQEFELVNASRRDTTLVFGQAYIDLQADVAGSLDALSVRGSVDLLGSTDVTYVMESSPLDVQSAQQDVVTFISFAGLDAGYLTDSTAAYDITGIDVLATININPDAKIGIFLTSDGQNNIELQGSGTLTYTLNQQGDSRFSGRYELTGGSVTYHPPIIPAKVFSVTADSYVTWDGEIANPYFNITAVNTINTNVTPDGGNSRSVNFNVEIVIRDYLQNLDVAFDLAAPNDIAVQNELSSMTGEQRSTQALALLLYNTYSGPGSTGRANINPLNTFIEKELNQWAQNAIPGVDLSFGIDSYDQVTDQGESTRTDYSYRLSKNLFNNRVRTVVGGSISDDSDDISENLIDDISIEYLLNKRENMYLRLFRHNTYESILEGEVTETGVGFVITKKMEKFGDLFRFRKRSWNPEYDLLKDHADDRNGLPAPAPAGGVTAMPAMREERPGLTPDGSPEPDGTLHADVGTGANEPPEAGGDPEADLHPDADDSPEANNPAPDEIPDLVEVDTEITEPNVNRNEK